jgi:hypothetical protein
MKEHVLQVHCNISFMALLGTHFSTAANYAKNNSRLICYREKNKPFETSMLKAFTNCFAQVLTVLGYIQQLASLNPGWNTDYPDCSSL